MIFEWIRFIATLVGFDLARQLTICPSYTLLNTRGTNETQGESDGFKIMNANVFKQIPGGKIYNTVYPAAEDQNTTLGIKDIVHHVKQALMQDPKECFILEGWSQGASATVDALPFLTDAEFDAIKGVFLIGNPKHKPGLACNFDNHGGASTRNGLGALLKFSLGIPPRWVSKTLDVCIPGDEHCDMLHPYQSGPNPHLLYPTDTSTQAMGTRFALDCLTRR